MNPLNGNYIQLDYLCVVLVLRYKAFASIEAKIALLARERLELPGCENNERKGKSNKQKIKIVIEFASKRALSTTASNILLVAISLWSVVDVDVDVVIVVVVVETKKKNADCASLIDYVSANKSKQPCIRMRYINTHYTRLDIALDL